MTEFEALYLGKFFFEAGTANYQHQLDLQEVEIKRRNAYKQASINNNLSYVAQLHVNEEDALDLKKTGLDQNELRQLMRRTSAKQAAQDASLGGGFGRLGQSVQATQLNIERHGYKALARKDLNREIRELSFNQRRQNAANEALSKNNALMSGIPMSPSSTGLALQIAGSGIQAAIGSKQGTGRGYARAQEGA
jgi:hypothetical protein